MKRLGPWLTLAAVVLLGLVLVAVNMSKETEPTAAVSNTPATTGVPSTAGPVPPTTGPAPVRFPPVADYVGTIPVAAGAPITLSITVEGDKAIAYACDGRSIESWLQGSAIAGVLRLTGKNEAALDGGYDGSTVTGTLALGQRRWAFSTAPVTAPAGLYVYTEAGVRQSWIIDASGAVTGVQRAADGTTSPAPGLAADATAIVNGKKVTANKVRGGDRVG